MSRVCSVSCAESGVSPCEEFPMVALATIGRVHYFSVGSETAQVLVFVVGGAATADEGGGWW